LPDRLGIVVIGRNEGERLRLCLQSAPRGVPLAYVDSASSDDSVSFARLEGAEVVELDMAMPFTAARARNEGLWRLLERWPKLSYVQFVDGDCELEAGWLEKASAFLDKNNTFAVVCGRRRERFREASPYNRWMDEEWDTPIGHAKACGGDALMRIAAVEQLGGFDRALIAGEEPELCARLRHRGWGICRLDAPMTIHDANMQCFRQWWLRAVRSGYGYAQVFITTRNGLSEALYGEELARALFWTVCVAGAACLLALIIGPSGLLLAPATWCVQFMRLAPRHGARKASYLLLGKVAEAFGALRYLVAMVRKGDLKAIYYK
jgi:GT2 family glycosyltransferase